MSEQLPLDPLTAARIAKEQKAAEEKGKHKSVKTSTIGRKGKTQGKGGMTFTDSDGEGEDPKKVVKREKNAGFSFQNFFKTGSVAVGTIQQPGQESSNDTEDE